MTYEKEKIINFIKEFICYLVVIAILQLIANKLGWTDASIIDNVIGLTIGWIIWKIIMILIDKKNE